MKDQDARDRLKGLENAVIRLNGLVSRISNQNDKIAQRSIKTQELAEHTHSKLFDMEGHYWSTADLVNKLASDKIEGSLPDVQLKCYELAVNAGFGGLSEAKELYAWVQEERDARWEKSVKAVEEILKDEPSETDGDTWDGEPGSLELLDDEDEQ